MATYQRLALSDDETGAHRVYRGCVAGYALVMPLYTWYRFAHTVRGSYMVTVCVLEAFGGARRGSRTADLLCVASPRRLPVLGQTT